MIPIGNSAPRLRPATINYVLIAANVAGFLYELSLGTRLDAFLHRYGVVPADVAALFRGDSPAPAAVVVTLFAAMFLHSGWVHLGSNMLFLWIFGDNVEDRFGHFPYLAFYLVCGLGAGLVQVYVNPASRVPLIGASGAIAGVLGAYLFLYPTAWVKVLVPIFIIFLPIDLPVILILGFWFVTQLANGVAAITETTQASGGVAYWAHVGGFVLGLMLTSVMPKGPRPASALAAGLAGAPPWIRVAVRIVSAVGGLVELIVVGRILLLVAGPTGDGLLRLLANVVVVVSWPLVEPFGGLLPVIRFDGARLETYALLALAVYHLLTTAIVWVLTKRPRIRLPSVFRSA